MLFVINIHTLVSSQKELFVHCSGELNPTDLDIHT